VGVNRQRHIGWIVARFAKGTPMNIGQSGESFRVATDDRQRDRQTA
jgi:hypothetical protein